MKLGISRYLAPQGQGRPLTAKSIRTQLENAGVRQTPVPGAPERVIELLRQGKDYRKVVLVRGLEPREPSDASIKPEGDLRFPVFPGQVIAHKLPPSQGEPGRTIDGRVIKPKATTSEHKKDMAVQAGENCTFDATDNVFIAQVYGIALIKEDSVHILPGLEISEDLTKILGMIHYRDHLGQAITALRFKDEISRLESSLPVNEDNIRLATAKAREERKLQREVPVVTGKEPINGADAWLEILAEPPPSSEKTQPKNSSEAHTESESLRIDYRERDILPVAEPGETIAQLHEPEQGISGLDIYGRPIPAHSGKVRSILPGENVVAREGGFFEAKDAGLVVVERGVLAVTQLLVINRDVDIATGNIRAELGSVKVRGTIQAGMTVIAPQHIVVDDTVEAANVEAGGDITVGGGLLMDNKGLIKAGGNVVASFANNARIQAGNNVSIKNNITNCHIEIGGMLFATKGKGMIQGGEIITVKGLEAKELGTELGQATTVAVVVKTEVDRNVILARRKIKREVMRVVNAIGDGDPKELLIRTAPAKRKAVAELIKYRMKLQKKLESIDQYMRGQGEKRQKTLAEARIKVWTSIHPGVTIHLGGRVLTVDRRIDRSQIYWNQDERRIIIGRLGAQSSN